MKISVHARELADLLDRAPAGLTTLSLDCFDTLLWRNVHAPRDVFAEIDLPGGGIEPRVWAEGAAHRLSFARRKTREVSLAEIYQRLLTRGTPEEIAAAVEHEIALEVRHCFAFAPVVALMREARARGLRIVIVVRHLSIRGAAAPSDRRGGGRRRAGNDRPRVRLVRIWCAQEPGTVRPGAARAGRSAGRDPARWRQSGRRPGRRRAAS